MYKRQDLKNKVQRELNFCIVDEVDSILIDEARTPIIISGAAEDKIKWYQVSFQVVSMLTRSYETEKIKNIKEKKAMNIPDEKWGDYEAVSYTHLLKVISSCVIGAAIAGGLTQFWGVSAPAPHGGIFVIPAMPSVHSAIFFVVSIAIGAIISGVIFGVIRGKKNN